MVKLLLLALYVPCLKSQYVSAFVIHQPKGPTVRISQVTLIGVPSFCVGMCQNPYITTSFFKTNLILNSTSNSGAVPFSCYL
ncbi:hypothetical protein I79_021678 [Cricetulus griseus]|uniref:Secreted protein n=1 Tax=Cricetulus griseus TaxID=10029 RepID=G3IDA2_CRIGR|nr:hypothetical protein I79_021678 [Cricetulus griseus]